METEINRNGKDRLFKFIFGRNEHREWTLSLYNAVNGSSYTNVDDITITTVEDALYLSMKNDVSFIIADTMNFYEHQSTYNPNMPIRMLMYSGMAYSKYINEHGIYLYSSALKTLPAPRLVTFYNGSREMEECVTLKLSDAFPKDSEPDIEVTVRMLNINHGRNSRLMEQCRPLSDYSFFTESVRRLKSEGVPTEEAVHLAIRKLDGDSPIRKYLLANEAEVSMLVITEFDEKKDREMCREEGLAEGTDRMARLGKLLLEAGRVEELHGSYTNPVLREKLLKEFAL